MSCSPMSEHPSVYTSDKQRLIDTQDEERPNYTSSLRVIMVLGFLMNFDIYLNLPSLENYVLSLHGTSLLYGSCIALFSLCQVLVAYPLSWVFDKNMGKQALVLMTLVCGFGNLIYALAATFDRLWMVVVGRAIAGIGAGVMVMNLSYISRVTPIHMRTPVMARYSVASLVALVAAPLMAFSLTFPSISPLPFTQTFSLVANSYTLPAFFMFGLCAICAILVGALVRKPEPRDDVSEDVHKELAESALPKLPPRVFICVSIFFFCSFSLSSFQTLVPIISSEFYLWDTRQNALLFMLIGSTAALSTLSVLFLSRHFRDTKILTCAQFFLLVGMMLSCRFGEEYPVSKFLASCAAISAGLSLSIPLIPSIYTRLVAEIWGGSDVSAMMGWLNASNNMARVIGPLWAALSVYTFSLGSNVCQWGLVGMTGASVILASGLTPAKRSPGMTRHKTKTSVNVR